ncbi:N-acetylmuramoyl-L-alanine amidase [Bradyrhizobium sp. SZCCHNR3118]|uniref:N-acetylmuramoyl-L-alanine amidase n=1 Tax=Bradyrhizobium sp. SZCCHNR3118 TaxID=3057468 RepID=UPI002916FA0B|nr:N-acetylmuramoyl-L-alanine amidase [Bradyrhizobium sp. SZCCHNR3118]
MSITVSKGLGFRDGRRLPFVRSPNYGGALKPRYIVIHDTASGLKDDGDISWLTNPAAKVSAHVVVSREGKITQLVPFDVVAWHAGQSQWKGLKFMNSYAIGIEIDNPGKLQKVSNGVYKNDVVTIDTNKNPALKVEYAKTSAHGAGYWLHYSDAQIAAVEELCQALCGVFKIEDIITHWMISPGRKIDTNPLYPLEALRANVLPYRPVGLLVEPEPITGGERQDTDESGEVHVALDPQSDVRDESATAPSKLRAFIKSKFTAGTGLFTGLSLSSFTGLLSDWKVITALGVFICIGLGLWIWSERK